jgi:hypothetical protein
VERSKNRSVSRRIYEFARELKRRKVFQVTSVYLVAAWGLSAGSADIFGVLDAPEWASRYLVISLFSMTPVVAILAWIFELSRSGIHVDYGPEIVGNPTVFTSAHQAEAITASFLGESKVFSRDFVVGRDDSCSFQIIDPLISRKHARFEIVGGRWQVRDLGSANGTSVNGMKVDTAWLDDKSLICFYPNSPALTLTLGHSASARTTIARPRGAED